MENRQNQTNINWYPGHMARTKKEIKEKINLVDLVYELIDARMPLSSKMRDMDDLLGDKPRILIMTKYDLCDQVETNKFIQYYQKKGNIVIPVDLKNGNPVQQIMNKSHEILVMMNEQRKRKGMKPRNIRALIIGVPNVGKSTLINRLSGKKATMVGNKPGVTKMLSWIRVNKDIELLDTPGLLWPKFENQKQAFVLASLSSIKEEIVDKEDLAIFILKTIYTQYPNRLKERYGVENIDDFDAVYTKIGQRRGALMKGGKVDYEKVNLLLIRDLKEGYLGKITLDTFEDLS